MTNQAPPARTRRPATADRKVGAFLRSLSSRRGAVRPWRSSADDGFVLLETVVAIGLIAVVMAAFTTFFVNTVAYTSQQRATQIAAQVATSTVDTIRSLPASDPVNGHDATSVTAQFASASAAVAPWLQGMSQATDPLALTAGSGLTAVVPTAAVTQTVNNVAYKVNVYLGTCVILTGVTVNASCAVAAAGSGIGYLRAVVAVTWTGARCPSTGCLFVTSTLLSPVDDPLFSQTQSPPAAPTLTNPGAQISAVGDTVSLQLTSTAVPSARFAVTSATLPVGLTLDTASGLISGTPLAVTSSTSLTLTLTDGFGRAATASFTWTVVPAITTTAPAAQASLIGTAITPLTLPAASGGSPGYTWSDPDSTLPPGLTLATVSNRAVISGTPTTQGVFPVTLTVTDSTTTRSSTVSFSWTTSYPPLVAANPGPQTATVNTADSVTLSVTGGSGSFAWTGGSTLPAGLTVTTAGVISGTPTAVGVKAVVLVVTDTKSQVSQNVSFSWTVYARPSVTSPGNQQVTVGLSASLQLPTTCPNAPCSYALVNGPSTFAISSSGLLAGTVTSAAQTFNSVTVTVTDSSGAIASSAGFVVIVNRAPSIANPGNQTVAPSAPDSLDVAALTTGGTAPLTYSAVNLPSWLTLNSSTGLITGTAPSVGSTTTGIVLTVRDSLGVSGSSAAFSWIVGGPPSAPLAVLVANGDTRVTPSWTAPTTGPVTSYTATLSPGGGSCVTSTLSCAITGLTNGVDYSVTVRATNGDGTGPASAAALAIPYPAVMSAANGMSLWLDGADPAVLLGSSACTGAVSTGAVGCWKDKSGAPLNNFVQTAAANQPDVGQWNGLPAVSFPDSGVVLNSVLASGQFQTVFVAANLTNTGTAAQYVNLFGQATQDTNVRVGSQIFRSAPNVNDWSSNSTGTGDEFNWANGAQGANVSPPVAIITTDQAPAVKTFAASVSNTFMSRGAVGQVGDVITFNRVLTTTERRAIEEYLARKWGVTITPQAPPSIAASVASTTSVNVSWAAPAFNGGSAVSGYTVTSSPGAKTCTTTALTCRVTGLTDNVTYRFTVTANNVAGAGPPSNSSGSVKP